ncbi:MAG: rubrerythrin family protein [Clostridia bacterium]|nr:rubrerythrin family protein [Clostridia bacterium]
MNNSVHSALGGTQTQQNLTDAFAGEARSAMRYRIFSEAARNGGDPVLSKILHDFAENELQHAELWMRYLGEVGDDVQNIEAILASEEYEAESMYPEYASTARDEGFSEIAEKFDYTASTEQNHLRILSDYLEKLRDGTLYTSEEEAGWLCTNCGYVHEGTQAPERCPLCGYPRGYFVKESD